MSGSGRIRASSPPTSESSGRSSLLSTPLRAAVAVAAAANLGLAAGFALQQPWATGLWPWETGRLSYLFLASMLAAVGVAAGWIAFSGETGSLPAGFLNLAITQAGIAVYPALIDGSIGLAAGIGALALLNLALFLATRRWPQPASDPLPALVRGSYVVFTIVLLVVGVALLLGRPGVMPWPVDPDTSVVFGWIFFGDAWYFAYAVARPHWPSARAQLWSFLGYDLVLLGPLAAAAGGVDPDLRLNLWLYLAVLTYSAVLAVTYLLVNRETRGWGTRRRRDPSGSPDGAATPVDPSPAR